MVKDASYKFRGNVILAVVFIGFLGMFFRLYQIQILGHEKFQITSDNQHIKGVTRPAYRGSITDRNNLPLAYTIKTESIYVNPMEIYNSVSNDDERKQIIIDTATTLSSFLDIPNNDIIKKCTLSKDSYGNIVPQTFRFIKRQITPEQSNTFSEMDLKGIHSIEEPKRLYPQNKLASTVIGFTNIDQIGLGGIEATWEKDLRGHPGTWIMKVDAFGNKISIDDKEDPNLPGNSITLTIDSVIQHYTEEALREACEKHQPTEGGSALVMNVNTGEVLAMANWPDYDPNFFSTTTPGQRRNRCVTDIYEPGSTWKTFTAAWAIEKGVAGPDDIFECERGAWKVPGIKRTVHDSHAIGGPVPFIDCYAKSSNVWAAKLGLLKLGKEKLYNATKAFGFGDRTGIKFIGEENGIVTPLRSYDKYAMTSIPYGQQITTTPLQLVTAYSAIVNGGNLMQPILVKKIVSPTGLTIKEFKPKVKRIILSENTSKTMRKLMRRVVTNGTGKRMALKLYDIGGKTGTAQKYTPGEGASHSKYVGSFCGVGPINKPEICVLVLLNEPTKGGYYGGVVAGPAVKKIMLKTLLYLKVPPDHPEAVDEINEE